MNEKHRAIAEDMFSRLSMAMSQTGKTIPVYIMILDDDNVVPIVVSEKDISLHEYSTLCINLAHQNNAQALMLVCEQYMVSKNKRDDDVELLLNGIIKASEHPDREQYLTLIYMDQQGKCESLISKIHKDPIGTPFTKDFKWVEDSVTSMITPWM